VEGADDRDHPHAEEGQEWFLNQVLEAETSLGPDELLSVIQNIESDIGRTAKHQWGNREIDIDILLYGNEVIESDHLTIPHRHMNDRQFILRPLTELDPHLKDPVSGESYQTILKSIKDEHKVTPFF
jgi:2-amino-4-hydroxy-6-hydroxymethyldihydropteridine diphosphokinase